jgi:hypothetical protein
MALLSAPGNPEMPDTTPAMSDDCQPLIEAATFLDRTIRLFLSQEGALQVETWIVAVARMAGTLILIDRLPEDGIAPAGSTVLSEAVDQEGPRLVRLMLLTLAHLGTSLEEGDIDAPEEGTALAQLSLEETREKLEPLVFACGRSHGLSLGSTADALIIATALAIHTSAELLAPSRGAGLAVAGLVEGARTMPGPRSSQD